MYFNHSLFNYSLHTFITTGTELQKLKTVGVLLHRLLRKKVKMNNEYYTLTECHTIVTVGTASLFSGE